MKISVFGDSILAGAISGENQEVLFELIPENSLALAAEKLGFELDNHSIYGSTITKGWRRYKKYLEKLDGGAEEKPDFIIIEFGGNDCDRDWALVSENPEAENPVRVSVSEYLEVLNQMVTAARERNITPVIMTMPPLVADYWINQITKGHDREKIISFINRISNQENPGEYLVHLHECYSVELKNYAVEHKVQYVDMRQAFEVCDNPSELMCEDGIHPNRKGYAMMAKIWERDIPGLKKEF